MTLEELQDNFMFRMTSGSGWLQDDYRTTSHKLISHLLGLRSVSGWSQVSISSSSQLKNFVLLIFFYKNAHGHISSNSFLEVTRPRSLLSVTTLRGSVQLATVCVLHLLLDTVEKETSENGDFNIVDKKKTTLIVYSLNTCLNIYEK